MKMGLGILQTGIGYYKLQLQRRKLLTICVSAALGVHVMGLLAFGSYVVISTLIQEKTVFVTPPPIKTYEPRKLEHKVKVQKRQRSSSRPQVTPRMVATRLTDLTLPEIKVDPKVIKTSFQPQFKAVTGMGLGVGLGTGFGIGGFGEGVSEIDFFGLRAKGERVMVCVDVSGSMVEDERGGPKGFLRVKQRVGKVIDALREGTMFNVVVFGDAAQTFKDEMLPATGAFKNDAKLFVEPYNTTQEQSGLTSGNVQGANMGLKALGGTTRLDLALTAAFQNGADTILIISDGIPRVLKEMTPEQLATWNAILEKWKQDNAKQETVQGGGGGGTGGGEGGGETHEEKVWVEPKPFKEGQPASPGHWVTRRVRDGRRGGGNRRASDVQPMPQMPDSMRYWTLQDFIKHFGLLNDELYAKKGKKPPVVHCIGYAIDKEGGDFLRDLAKHYGGNYRRVASL
jgi:hypothetical protein